MLKHQGRSRTFTHNLRLASLLSAVAGIVNISGLLALGTLTTNVTGHFAFFSEQFSFHQYGRASIFLVYIFFFLGGAFCSGLLIETLRKKYNYRIVTAVPLGLEIVLLILIAQTGDALLQQERVYMNTLSCILLFTMGLQNALVTKVSQSVVRTTHLTGIFTDMGIELAQLKVNGHKSERTRLRRSLFLKGMIIGCFFAGGIIGGFAYRHVQLKALYIAVALLLFTVWYDRLLFRYYLMRRKVFVRNRAGSEG